MSPWFAQKSMAVVEELARLADLVRGNEQAEIAVVNALHNATKLMAFDLAPEPSEDSHDGWSPNDAGLILAGGHSAFAGLVKRYEAGDDAGYRAELEQDAAAQARRDLEKAMDKAGLPMLRNERGEK